MKTEEDILTKSREVLETKGEWDLIDIKAAPYFLHLTGGSYQEVKFHVSKAYFECTNTNTNTRLDFITFLGIVIVWVFEGDKKSETHSSMFFWFDLMYLSNYHECICILGPIKSQFG